MGYVLFHAIPMYDQISLWNLQAIMLTYISVFWQKFVFVSWIIRTALSIEILLKFVFANGQTCRNGGWDLTLRPSKKSRIHGLCFIPCHSYAWPDINMKFTGYYFHIYICQLIKLCVCILSDTDGAKLWNLVKIRIS